MSLKCQHDFEQQLCSMFNRNAILECLFVCFTAFILIRVEQKHIDVISTIKCSGNNLEMVVCKARKQERVLVVNIMSSVLFPGRETDFVMEHRRLLVVHQKNSYEQKHVQV